MKIHANVLLIFFLLLISITAVSAVDIQYDDDNALETSDNNDLTTKDINKIVKTGNDNIKENSQTVTVTKDNYNTYFNTNASGNVHTTDKIKSGDIINLQGTFNDLEFNADKENVVITSIDKTANLFNCTVYIDGQNNKGVQVSNLNIKNNKDNCEGIILVNAVNATVSNNHIYVNGSDSFALTSHTMHNCIIENNYMESVHTQTNMRIYSSDNNIILNNTVIGYANCIYLCAYEQDTSNNNLIKHNTVIGKLESPVCYTIQVMGIGNIIEENTVSGGYRGISSEFSNIIRNNDVDASNIGIYSNYNATIENNNVHVSKDSVGISVLGNETIVNNNVIIANASGIVIKNNDVTITNNKIISLNDYAILSKMNRNGYTGIVVNNNNMTGGVYNTGSMNLTGNKIQYSVAVDGAAIYNTGNISLTNNTIHSNNATNRAGAIYTSGKVELTNNLIMQNNATTAGIIYKTNKGVVIASDNTFINNYPVSFENVNSQLVLVDAGNFIPKNASVTIYEDNMMVKETTINDSVIDYSLSEGIDSYSLIISNGSFVNNNFTYTTNAIPIKKDLLITINPINPIKYGNSVVITGKFMNANGTIRPNNSLKVKINGKPITTRTDANGEFSVTSKVGVIGINNVTASHEGDNNYNPTSTNATFMMTKQDLIITINPIATTSYGKNVTISGRFVDGDGNARANNEIKVNINGKSLTATTDKNGYYNYTTSMGKVGTNNVTVSHSGGANYNPAEATETYEVVKQDLNITLNPLGTVTYGAVTINGRLTDGLGNPRANTGVKLLINGKSATAKTDANGYFKFTTKAVKVGVNNVTASHNGGGNYNPTSTNTTFTMVKKDLRVTIDPIATVTYGDSVKITGKFTDGDGNIRANSNLKVIINGKTLTVTTDANGKFTATSKVGVVGINNVTVAHSGGTGFNPTSSNATFTMIKQNLTVTINKISDVKQGSTVTITGKFTDGNGKIRANTNLKVNINGNEDTTKTNSKGEFTYITTANTIGTNKVTISHNGGANYNPTNSTKTFTVTK